VFVRRALRRQLSSTRIIAMSLTDDRRALQSDRALSGSLRRAR
jgi:hypothetical protein